MLMALKNAKKTKDKRDEDDREDIDNKHNTAGTAQVPKNIRSNRSLPLDISEAKLSKIQVIEPTASFDTSKPVQKKPT